jgi:hypothetical protein
MKQQNSRMRSGSLKLQEIHNEAKKVVATVELKEKSKFVREIITEAADSLGIDLKLKNKR